MSETSRNQLGTLPVAKPTTLTQPTRQEKINKKVTILKKCLFLYYQFGIPTHLYCICTVPVHTRAAGARKFWPAPKNTKILVCVPKTQKS